MEDRTFLNQSQQQQQQHLFKNNLVHYSVLFNFGHIRRWDQCAVYILTFTYTINK